MAEQRHHPDPYTPHLEADSPQAAAPIQADSMPESVATIIRAAREAQNVSLREVAAGLNIRYVYLQAIEDGEFGKLPGTTYAIGFLRSYAEHLGLDAAELTNRFKAEVAGLNKQTQLVFPTPVPEGKVPGGALILVSVLFLALAYGAWSYFAGQDEQIADVVPVVPERLQDLLNVEPPGAGAVPAEPVAQAEPAADVEPEVPAAGAAERPEAVAAAEPATGVSVQAASEETVAGESPESGPSSLEAVPFETAPIGSEATAPPSEQAQAAGRAAMSPPQPDQQAAAPNSTAASETPPAAASPEPSAGTEDQTAATAATEATAPQAIPTAPSTQETAAALRPFEAQVYGRGNLDSRIVLRATQDAWVQVRDSNEDLLFTRVLRAGDSYRVPNQAGLTLLTGNAGGLAVEVDGSDLGPLGAVGSVRRNVVLEPDKLRDGSNLGQ